MEENKMKNIIKNIVNAKKEKTTQKLPMPSHVKKGFRRYCAVVVTATICSSMVLTASATGGDPLTVVNNLSDFIFGMIRAVGMILLGWGIVQVGLSLQSHDPSQRSNGFLTLAGGIIITFSNGCRMSYRSSVCGGMAFSSLEPGIPRHLSSRTSTIWWHLRKRKRNCF